MIKLVFTCMLGIALASCGGGDNDTTVANPSTPEAPSNPNFDPTPKPTDFRPIIRNEWVILDINLGENLSPGINSVGVFRDSVVINGTRIRDASTEGKKTKIRARYFSPGKNFIEITTETAKFVGEANFAETDLIFLGVPRRIGDRANNALATVAEHPDEVAEVVVSIDGGPPIRSSQRECFGYGDWYGFICTGEQAFVTEHPALSAGTHRAIAKMVTKTGKEVIGEPFDFLVSTHVSMVVSHCQRAANTNGTGEFNAVTIVGTTSTDRTEPTFISFYLDQKEIGRIPVNAGFRWFTHTMNLTPPLPNGDYIIMAVANNIDGSDVSGLPENKSSCLLKLR